MFQTEKLPEDLATPTLVVDEAAVRGNIERLASYCASKGLQLRPHTKTHKSIRIGQMQMEAGAAGLTVAKSGEAEVMATICNDLLVAYPAVGIARLKKLASLAREHQVTIGLDSMAAAEQLSATAAREQVMFGVLIDLDVGFHRTGWSDLDLAIESAAKIARLPGLNLKGIMCFPGNVGSKSDDPQWKHYIEKFSDFLKRWEEIGLPQPIVSGGSTPTAMLSHLHPLLTEIRPGTYVYNDINEVKLGVATFDQCAARVIATVVSSAVAGKFVVDAGSKMLSSDRCGPDPDAGFGYVLEYPEAKIVRLSEEHGEVQLPEGITAPAVGSRVTIIPNHICPCVNLQNHFWLYRIDGGLEQLPVDARGCVQ